MFSSCRKDDCEDSDTLVTLCNYNNYSTADYDFIWSDLFTIPSPTGPHFTPNAEFFYSTPVFNPLNPMQIAYERLTYPPLFDTELWVFDFCTGQAEMIADNFNYDLDWGTNGWLLYTGGGGQSYKIRSNGDSLTLLPSINFVTRTGTWNPAGTMFWRNESDGTHYVAHNGEEFHFNSSYPFSPVDWLNDSTILGWRDDNLYSMLIPSEELTILNSNWTCATCFKFYNIDQNTCYVVKENNPLKLLSYSLNGDNIVDTIKNNIQSHHYSHGDYLNGKIVTRLIRREWADSIGDNRLFRHNILIMDDDASNERLVELPE